MDMILKYLDQPSPSWQPRNQNFTKEDDKLIYSFWLDNSVVAADRRQMRSDVLMKNRNTLKNSSINMVLRIYNNANLEFKKFKCSNIPYLKADRYVYSGAFGTKCQDTMYS